MKTLHVTISGKVQGVWYRAWTAESATKLGIHGWVRNRLDGKVEAVFSGENDIVDRMIEACKEGSPAAKVESVSYKEISKLPENGFRQLPTM